MNAFDLNNVDPEYIAFLQSMNAEPTEADKEMKLSGTELCTSWKDFV